MLDEAPDFAGEPKLLLSTDNYDLWYKKDDKFQRPKAFVSLKLYTDDCQFGRDPKSRVFAHVWNEVANDFMREFNYMATCASLSLGVGINYDVVDFRWQGFNDSLPTYVDQSLNRLQDMKGKVASGDLE